jgi:adenine-specific DNA-methyltransferase
MTPMFIDNRVYPDFRDDCQVVLHHGDVAAFLPTLPSSIFTLIMTSPPYNLGKSYEQQINLHNYLQQQEAVIDQLIRVLADDGSICWEVGNFVHEGEVIPLDVLFYDIFKRKGLKLRNRIIWHFAHGLHASRRFSGRYETILWFTKSDHYTFNLDHVRVPAKYPGKTYYKGPNRGKLSGNPLGANPSDLWALVNEDWDAEVWEIPNVKANHAEKTSHPCQYPVELAQRCVLALTNEEDWVFDPYVGVGSTMIAGLIHNRKVVGCDKEQEYVNIAAQRISGFFSGTLKLRKLGTPVHQPTGREKVAQIPMEWTTLR